MKKKKQLKLDDIDYRLIYQLEEDSALPMSKLSEKLGIPHRKVEYRINRLIKYGVITHFIAVLDYSKLGYYNHEVWIQLGRMDIEKRERFKRYIVKHPKIWWVASCAGKFDYAIGILAENVVEFSEILNAIISDNQDLAPRCMVSIPTKVTTYNRTYLLKDKKSKKVQKSMMHLFSGIAKKVMLDEIARKILLLLSKDAKMTINQIADEVGVSPNTVRARIKWLEKTKVIQGYKAMIQPKALGVLNYEVLIATKGLSADIEREFEEYCNDNPYVVYLLSTLGKWDINIVMDAEDAEHFQKMLVELRTKFNRVILDYEYVPVLKVRKFGLQLTL